MADRFNSPLRYVICSRCGVKIVIREVKVSHRRSYPQLMDCFERSFVCFTCLNKLDKRI